MTVLEYLRAQGIEISSDCGGNGTCGKCLVEIKDDNGNYGLHKACKITFKEGMTIRLVDKRSEMAVVSCIDVPDEGKSDKESICYPQGKSPEYGISIDIGTTTEAAVLHELNSGIPGSVIASKTAANSQKTYGFDVISRIKAFNDGKGQDLTDLLREDIRKLISGLIMDSGVNKISTVSIAGNATMVHSLMGYDLSGLGRYPYETVATDLITTTIGGIFKGLDFMNNTKVYIMPGTGAFIGGDIISGLFSCGLPVDNQIDLFIDLGTNGEMAITYNGVIFTASTAAGPVFEGSSISCGLPGIGGAIHTVNINNGSEITFDTINKLPPIGLCGTGVIELTAELLKNGFITREGFLEKEFQISKRVDGKTISFTQNDVRQVQLAKASIRAGIDILVDKIGCYYNDISRVFLAGGFGYHIDPKKAACIGMIPKEVSDRTIAPGNTSLAGAVKLLSGDIKENLDKIEKIRNNCRYIDLATEEDFEKRYIKELNF